MGDRRCCDDDCRIDITGWEQYAGFWNFTNFASITTDESHVVLQAEPTHPEAKSTHYVSVSVKGDSDGDVLRVVVAFDTIQDYLYAELEVGTTNGILRLFQVTGGSAFQLGDDVTVTGAKSGELHDMTVCYDGEVLTAIVNSTTSYAQLATATGTYVGMATGAITTLATFSSFKWYIHYDDGGYYDEPNNCPRCAAICSACKDNEGPRHFKVVIEDLGSGIGCSAYHGTYIVPIETSCAYYLELAPGAWETVYISIIITKKNLIK